MNKGVWVKATALRSRFYEGKYTGTYIVPSGKLDALSGTYFVSPEDIRGDQMYTLEEMQEAFKLFYAPSNSGGLLVEELSNIFNGKTVIKSIEETYSAEEIVRRITEYKNKKDKIKVGDIVKTNIGLIGMVTYVNDRNGDMSVLFRDGSCAEHLTENSISAKIGSSQDGALQGILKALQVLYEEQEEQ